MTTVLVSGASGIVGYGILRALRKCGRKLRLIGTSIHGNSVAPAFCDLFELAPRTDHPGYFDWLRALVRRENVSMLIPGIEIDFYAWHENRAALTASGVEILLNNPSLIDLCKDKWAFYQKLVQLAPDLAIASSLEADFDQLKSRFGLPLLLKPRRGFGSKGVVRVHDEAGFIGFSTEIGRTLMVQPVVGTDDEEYTVAAFGDGKGGYRAAMAMRRTLSSDGFTGTAEVVGLAPFEDALRRLSSHFLPVGPCNFQFRKTSADLKLLEINPRISSSTSIRTAFGYNESAMAVEFLLSGDLPVQPVIRGGRAVRYTEDQLFYEDGIHF